jgi:hypothetical protein
MILGLLRVAAVAATVLALGCAGKSSEIGSEPQVYRRDLPNATPTDLVESSVKILNRYTYRLERVDQSAYVRIESGWISRYPLDDEIDVGIVKVLTRIVITGRPRGRRGPGVGNVRIATLTAENQVLFEDSVEWVRGFLTPMFREYMNKIVSDLRTELDQGVRRF